MISPSTPVLLSGNIAKDAKVAVINLDNSAYSRELINHIEASEFMKVTAVLNTPQDPKELFYQDKAVAVVYFPPGLEKARYTGEAANLGVFYDNTSSAATSNIKEDLNEIVGLDNAVANGDVGSSNDSLQGQLSLASRNLFNPQDSKDNGETLGFLLFFGAMFFTFATIGISYVFPLTWEFHFQRDIIARGAGFLDISQTFGAFLLYTRGFWR
ncbi:ABC-2 family transporter protein [Selenomonas sp. GACV-9]|uniref:ABC transporter permease n=1 Tax=Selenomonas sp. GACV-9 TaxID=3158782 RepID=UPI0008F36B06|nr:ABC-2 family transporter protein [Selenomonas ruminantium]